MINEATARETTPRTIRDRRSLRPNRNILCSVIENHPRCAVLKT